MKRKRIHPAVLAGALPSLAAIAIVAQLTGSSQGEALKVLAATIIAFLFGVKLRPVLPVT